MAVSRLNGLSAVYIAWRKRACWNTSMSPKYALTLKAGVMRNSILLLCIWETQGNNICNVTKFASCQIVQIFHARADARNRMWNFTSFIYYNISNMHASMYINWLKGFWKILNKGLNFIRVITWTGYLCITWPRCQCVNSYGTIT